MKEFGIAQTIYNLKYQNDLKNNNFKFEIDKTLKIVKHVHFIEEKENIIFSDITGRELYRFFSCI